MAIWGTIAMKFVLLNLFVVPTAWIFYIVILFVVLILLAGIIISMVFNDDVKVFVLGIIYSLL